MTPKLILHPDEIERQVKVTRALIRAAERALARHAKKTRTVFIGRAGSVQTTKGAGDP